MLRFASTGSTNARMEMILMKMTMMVLVMVMIKMMVMVRCHGQVLDEFFYDDTCVSSPVGLVLMTFVTKNKNLIYIPMLQGSVCYYVRCGNLPRGLFASAKPSHFCAYIVT